jgi:serine/threonine protein phosphatase PrpC
MEDTHITDTTSLGKGINLFSVFDGHGGHEVASYLRDNFWNFLRENENFKEKRYELALIQTFKEIDESLIHPDVNEKLKEISNSPKKSWDKPGIKGVAYSVGSTACVALITPESIFVANLGDSRCIISKNGKAFEMSVDHKPSLSSEMKRIKAAGGFVKDDRIQGVLNLSRSFGDMHFKSDTELHYKKQLVISVPEICEQPRSKDIDFLFIACDGIWECMDSSDVSKSLSKFKHK